MSHPRRFRRHIDGRRPFRLWEQLLLDWLPLMRKPPKCCRPGRNRFRRGPHAAPGRGRIDMGVMYTPQSRPGSSWKNFWMSVWCWFRATRKRCLNRVRGTSMSTGDQNSVPARPLVSSFPRSGNHRWYRLAGPAAHSSPSGSGYFPLRLARPHVAAGHLSVIQAAPQFPFQLTPCAAQTAIRPFWTRPSTSCAAWRNARLIERKMSRPPLTGRPDDGFHRIVDQRPAPESTDAQMRPLSLIAA